VHNKLIIEPILHLGAGARQKACAQPVRCFPQPQIEACRLNLVVDERRIRNDPALLDRSLQL
jgi:hypothetical protein